jgi:2-phosphosulfolactate phosphatase
MHTMSHPVHVHLLPKLVDPETLARGVVVVIDVLRASTTMIHALAAGAEGVIPCGETDEARAIAAARPAGLCVLGGEREGVRIAGFDLGNTPTDYTPASVGGKTVVFTTTNGTRALAHGRRAARVIVGAFANLSAVARYLARGDRPAHLLCAGTDGQITLEDVLFAGGVLHALGQAPTGDAGRLAWDAWGAVANDTSEFVARMLASRGGANLVELGLAADVHTCARIDTCAIVPELGTDGVLRCAAVS